MKCFPFNNRCFWLFSDEVLSWNTKDEETDEIITPNPVDIAIVLDSVTRAFRQHYGSALMDKLRVCVFPCGDAPTTFWNMRIIGLTARGRFWCQYAFQFAHELCHHTIQGDVAQPLRWFEESICELASIFYLYEMKKIWSDNPPYEQWRSYAQCFGSYADSRTKNDVAQIPAGLSFSEFIAEKMESLTADCYQRDINLLCAAHMYPIFAECPQLWKEVPLLSKLSAEPDFKFALAHWKGLANERQAIEKIIELFTIG